MLTFVLLLRNGFTENNNGHQGKLKVPEVTINCISCRIKQSLYTYDCQNKICETQVLLLDFRLLQVRRPLNVGRRVS